MQGQSSSSAAADKARGQAHRALLALCGGIAFIGAVSIDARGAAAYCGDDIREPSEDCDDGGVCIGGPSAGSECSSEPECIGAGACFGGLDDLRVCTSSDDCRLGTCRHCRPVGGDGCAANCTLESPIRAFVVDGFIAPSQEEIVFGTSGAILFGPLLTIPLRFRGAITLTVGRSRDGVLPVVIKTSDVDLDRIPIGLPCVCVRGATQFTCGGTLLEPDGHSTDNCDPGAPDAVECPEQKPCAALHGDGNTASGFISCGGPAVDVEVTRDCNATPGAAPFAGGGMTLGECRHHDRQCNSLPDGAISVERLLHHLDGATVLAARAQDAARGTAGR